MTHKFCFYYDKTDKQKKIDFLSSIAETWKSDIVPFGNAMFDNSHTHIPFLQSRSKECRELITYCIENNLPYIFLDNGFFNGVKDDISKTEEYEKSYDKYIDIKLAINDIKDKMAETSGAELSNLKKQFDELEKDRRTLKDRRRVLKKEWYNKKTKSAGKMIKTFRVTLDHSECTNFGIERPSDRWEMFQEKGFKFNEFKKDGSDILICEPSVLSLWQTGMTQDEWTTGVVNTLKEHTDRRIITREKPSRKQRVNNENTLVQFLDANDVFATVSYHGAAATESVMYGIPAFADTLNSAADVILTLNELDKIETPLYPSNEEKEKWANTLSYQNFYDTELYDGTAKEILLEYIKFKYET